MTSQSFLQHKFLRFFSGQICKNKCCQNLFSQNFMSLRRTTKLRKIIHPRPPKCKCNNGMHPIAKFVFQMIFNCNIFHTFRKVIPSLCDFKLEAIKAVGINFRKHHSAT